MEIKHLTFHYKDKVIFEDASFIVENPGIYLLSGENGIGKTTLLNILSKKFSCSYSLQNSYLLSYLTIKEQFDLFKIDYSILDRVNLGDKLSCYPSALSDGERQRISVLLALFSNSDIVLLDEPFASIDADNSLTLLNIIKEIKNKIIIIVSHLNLLKKRDLKGTIKIKDHKIIIKKKRAKNRVNITNKKRKLSIKIIKKEYANYIKDRLKIYLIYILGFLIITSLFFVKYTFTKFINKDYKSSVEMNKYYLSKCDENKSGGIVIKKCSNPSTDELENFDYKLNYDYLLVYFYERDDLFVSNKEVSLKEGRYPLTHNEVIADDRYNIGDTITLYSNVLVGNNKVDIYKENKEVNVVGIINSLHFYNQDGIYFDYNLLDEYYENYLLINNNESIKEYFNNLEIDNYKYVVFLDEPNESILLQGKVSGYYKEISKIKDSVSALVGTLSLFFVMVAIYNFARYVKRNIEIKKEMISYLLKNSFSGYNIAFSLLIFDTIVIIFILLVFAFISYLISDFHCFLLVLLECNISLIVYIFFLIKEVYYDSAK